MNIFFDLDGTLIDTIYDISYAVNEALKLNNLKQISLEEVKNNLGHGSKNLITKCSHDNFSLKLYDDYKKIYHDNLCNLSKIYPYVLDTLIQLKNRDIVLGVYSNKDENDVIKIINHYLPNLFTYIIGKRSNYPLKPDPSLMESIIKNNNLDINDFYYVGDMQTDKDLAINLGVKFIYASYGYSKVELDSEICIKNFKELSYLFAKESDK